MARSVSPERSTSTMCPVAAPSTNGSMPAPSGGLSTRITLNALFSWAISSLIFAEPSISGPWWSRVPQGISVSPLWLVGRRMSWTVASPPR